MSTSIDRVIVTGASSGIGFDAARRFVQEGSRVIINARDAGKLEKARQALGHSDRVLAIAGAVGDAETGGRLAAAAKRHFGGVDVLVNNAGVFGAKPFLESTVADLDAFYTTNVKGTFLVSQAVVPLLTESAGSIINIGTVIVEQPNKNIPCAAAMTSKGGVHALTRSLAVELAARTDILRALAEYAASQSALQLEITKQYPDIHLNPGYQWDQGEHKWQLGLSAELPVLNRNQGPIAEAEARRAEAAARFEAMQAKVLAEIDHAVAVLVASRKNLDALQSVSAAQKAQRDSVEAQIKVGAAERLDLLNAQFESSASALAELDAQLKWQQAFGALEDAVQQPLDALPSPRIEPSPRAERSKP